MKKLLLSIFAVFVFSGCVSESDAKRALQNAGFTDIQITGFKPFACSDDDFNKTGFTAVNPQGVKVSGTVCSGLLFKNATIRF